MIYYVQYLSDKGPIKIGFTDNLNARLMDLRSDHPFTVTILGFHEGSLELEKQLHDKFNDIKWPDKKEYFRPEDKLLRHIKKKAHVKIISNDRPDNHKANEVLLKKYKSIYLNDKQAAEFLSLSVQTLRNWRYQGMGPKFHKPTPKVVRYRLDELTQWMEEGLH
jgi:hypothetical protein